MVENLWKQTRFLSAHLTNTMLIPGIIKDLKINIKVNA